MNRIQNKSHKRGTYEINKISLLYFKDKIYILKNGCDGLALGYQSQLHKTVILLTTRNSFIGQAIKIVF